MEEKKYSFEITESDYQNIIAALLEIPFKFANNVIVKLDSQKQAQEQVNEIEKAQKEARDEEAKN